MLETQSRTVEHVHTNRKAYHFCNSPSDDDEHGNDDDDDVDHDDENANGKDGDGADDDGDYYGDAVLTVVLTVKLIFFFITIIIDIIIVSIFTRFRSIPKPGVLMYMMSTSQVAGLRPFRRDLLEALAEAVASSFSKETKDEALNLKT